MFKQIPTKKELERIHSVTDEIKAYELMIKEGRAEFPKLDFEEFSVFTGKNANKYNADVRIVYERDDGHSGPLIGAPWKVRLRVWDLFKIKQKHLGRLVNEHIQTIL